MATLQLSVSAIIFANLRLLRKKIELGFEQIVLTIRGLEHGQIRVNRAQKFII